MIYIGMTTENKKIKNATKVEVNGIKFRSKLEAYTYKKLKENNIQADYESKRYILLEKFKFFEESIRAMTYLPDFVGKGFVIECKGWKNDAWPLREKLFKYYLTKNEPNTKFYLVRTQKQVDALIDILKQK